MRTHRREARTREAFEIQKIRLGSFVLQPNSVEAGQRWEIYLFRGPWPLAAVHRPQGGKDTHHAYTRTPNPLEKERWKKTLAPVRPFSAGPHRVACRVESAKPFSGQQGCSLYIGMITQRIEGQRGKDTCCTVKRSTWILDDVPVLSPIPYSTAE